MPLLAEFGRFGDGLTTKMPALPGFSPLLGVLALNSSPRPEAVLKSHALQMLRACRASPNLAQRLDFRLRETSARRVGVFTTARILPRVELSFAPQKLFLYNPAPHAQESI